MIKAAAFIEQLRARGFSHWAGVPCSYLKPFINYVIDDKGLNYTGAASEGEAVGISMGTYLAGKNTVTMCQNSGLGNMVNPLTSLNYPFRVPTLLITTWRGEPGRPLPFGKRDHDRIIRPALPSAYAAGAKRRGAVFAGSGGSGSQRCGHIGSAPNLPRYR